MKFETVKGIELLAPRKSVCLQIMCFAIAVQRHIISKLNTVRMLIEQTQNKSINLERIARRHETGY